MNTKHLLASGVAIFALATAAYSQTTVINITGATAFRAAANNSLIAVLGGAGVTQYAFTGTQGIGGSNRAIFRGTIAGIPGTTIVRTSWSGSTAGVAAVAANTPVELLLTSTEMTTGGNNVAAPAFEFAPAAFAFSDVAQASTPTLSPTLTGTQVGVVPFGFVVNQSANAHPLMTNMTDQIMNAIYSTSEIPLRFFTGVPGDNKRVLAVGRNPGSGTRPAVLAETGYGIFRPVQQFTSTHTGTGAVAQLDLRGNDGYASNSGIRDLMQGTTAAVDLAEGGVVYEEDADVLVLSWLTVSDWLAVTTPPSGVAKGLTYNGVAYSEERVKQGAYSLWSYQWFYQTSSITTNESTFRNVFTASIPNTLGTAAIPIPSMVCTRSGGDGGPIFP